MENCREDIKKSSIRKEQVSLLTYPFSDPSPIPEFGRLYPYNRFDGYTTEGTVQVWEMIVMENDFIKLWINPAVGGKIWGAIEKSTGKEFIYFNHVAKFRDMAMRGPWTSGGMEINMGIIGHSPSCSSPVDYHIQQNDDSSVSCFIGATDWPSRTEWRVEIKLPHNAAYFTTNCWWYNNSCLQQSYYQWNNVGVKVGGNLEFVYPGNKRLGHDGKSLSWPIDDETHNLSLYNQNNQGEYKSYHIFGSYTDFWGCYWHKDNFGLGHTATYDDKPGKKIWIWGLSRYGMIWEDLLTDYDGQYAEVQSGRLFNQSVSSSSKTPFKHRSFLPYTYDTWNEYWFPVKNIGGLSYGNHLFSFAIIEKDGKRVINICATQPLNDTLKILHNTSEVLNKHISLITMQTVSYSLPVDLDLNAIKILLNDEVFYNAAEQNEPLKRPTEIVAAYDFNSVQAVGMQAKEWERQRFFERAIKNYKLCLEKDPYYIMALTGLAGIYFRQMKYEDALALLLTALSIDTYDGEANYLYGLVNIRLHDKTNAKDGFSISSQSIAYRTASYLELAKIFICEGENKKALSYIEKSLQFQPSNRQSSCLEIIIHRLKGDKSTALSLTAKFLKNDPISYIAKFELSRLSNTPVEKLTTSEMPYETYIEAAVFYSNLNLYHEAIEILSLSPQYALVSLWQAWLFSVSGEPEKAALQLNLAASLTPAFVFPHREEDVKVLIWAVNNHNSWKFKYYLALAYIQNSRKQDGLQLLEACDNEPDFYPFYIIRAELKKTADDAGCLADLKNAKKHARAQWRTALLLSKYFAEKENWKNALKIAQQAYQHNKANYYAGLQLAKCLMHTHQYTVGIELMNTMNVLPNEGAADGRNSWRETHLYAALESMDNNNWEQAIYYIRRSKIWPENMGVGKPYHVDERLEDFIEFYCLMQHNREIPESLINAIKYYRDKYKTTHYGSTDFLSILLLRYTGEFTKSYSILADWIRQDTSNLALQWSKAFINDNMDEVDLIGSKKQAPIEILPYEIPFDDRSFPFIKELYKRGIFKKFKLIEEQSN